LAPASNFTRTPNGYQPNPEPPQAPAGLKPVELQAWTAMAQRNSGEPALVPTFTVQDTQAISASSNRYMRLVISP
jgi:hypothetical protein